MKVLLLLENGMTFEGRGFGKSRDVLCGVVFNSAMYGYTELLTDPGYISRSIVMTYPMIGNYGICYENAEVDYPWVEAFIAHSASGIAGNSRYGIDLGGHLKDNRIPGISGIGTRALTRYLRESSTIRGMFCFGDQIDRGKMKRKIVAYVVPNGISQVSICGPRGCGNGLIRAVLLNYGIKENIICPPARRGCAVRRFPNDMSFEEIKAWNPDGVMLSNGPGDPQVCVKEVAGLRRAYQSDIPVFTTCMGHQLMALSQGTNTYKLKCGYRGINHPMKGLKTNRVHITSQSHGYVVDTDTIDSSIVGVNYVSVNDQSVEGPGYKNDRVFPMQFHPETCSGPLDTGFLLDRLMNLMGGGCV